MMLQLMLVQLPGILYLIVKLTIDTNRLKQLLKPLSNFLLLFDILLEPLNSL